MDIKDFRNKLFCRLLKVLRSIKTTGALIPGMSIYQTDGKDYQVPLNDDLFKIIDVDFDIAVTVSETFGTNKGAELKVAGFLKAGISVKGDNQNQTVSRIKYTLPLVLPE